MVLPLVLWHSMILVWKQLIHQSGICILIITWLIIVFKRSMLTFVPFLLPTYLRNTYDLDFFFNDKCCKAELPHVSVVWT